MEEDLKEQSSEILQDIEKLYDEIMAGAELVNLDTPSLNKLNESVQNLRKRLGKESRTAKLWLQYMDYVAIYRLYIRAARTGDWNLHLSSTSKMLNLFAATGHIHYAKSARLYLQMMTELPKTHPWLHERFSEDGLFVVRRSDRFWAGIWPDLSIEQIMMRALKSRGGLTRGRGFTESVRTMWVYTMHEGANYHNALCTSTNNQHKTSEQHTDLGYSRRQRDFKDLQIISTWLKVHNPFSENIQSLQALGSGLIADEKVNCDDAEDVGRKIQIKLDGVSINNAVVKRNEQAITLASLKPSIQIGEEEV